MRVITNTRKKEEEEKSPKHRKYTFIVESHKFRCSALQSDTVDTLGQN